ncbi:MAG: zeta toxin family protein [Oscillospiraceae bacterium]|nr:zeta toxin family protein [Oscillospiraceae bacterium]
MKKYLIFAGVNGSGKTTLYRTNEEFYDMPRINLDEIVREFGSWKNSADVTKAGRIALQNIRSCFERNISFNQETTLCGKNILKNIYKAKEQGYMIDLLYVGVDSPETAIKRVAQRVRDGGHGIPEEDIRRRYVQSLANLKDILPVCDRVEIYDNSDIFQLIATFTNGKCIDKAKNTPKWCYDIISAYVPSL